MCDKGQLNGICNRKACNSKRNVVFFNDQTYRYYCPKCARAINESAGYEMCSMNFGCDCGETYATIEGAQNCKKCRRYLHRQTSQVIRSDGEVVWQDPTVSTKETGVKISLGGLMRCCHATFNEIPMDEPLPDGRVIPCEHCSSSMVVDGDIVKWLQPKEMELKDYQKDAVETLKSKHDPYIYHRKTT